MLTHKQVLAEQLEDPKFRKAWEESEPAYQLKRLRLIKTSKRKMSRKPAQLKEARAEYVVSKNGREKEVQLEFHICLPKNSDLNGFADKLIELVEAYNGKTGGGIIDRHK